MRVIGTAGHVDHGKSTLVQRLTNIDPDRLAEEKQRQMTIDLGFAWLTLPNQETVGIVDVPGHRDFIENMLAGVGGIDAVLLVIAADEGVMPQTREHLAILDLLGINQGLIILSKIDLVNDPEWLELLEQDIWEVTGGTSLENAPILPVSAQTGAGISELVETLTNLLEQLPPTREHGVPRLPIDRVFTISGFGTVVTGTLLNGSLQVGDEIEIQPGALRGRVRGLQNYERSSELAPPGSRTAVNITGVEKSALQRGQVLTYPGQMQPTILVDAFFRHLLDASRPLKHNSEVKFFSGAAETTARVRLLSNQSLAPGEEGWLQLRLDQPIALTQQDRYIIRYPSPAETIGGGVVVNPHPGRRWKRHQEDVIAQLQLRLEGTPAERLTQIATYPDPVSREILKKQTGFDEAELDSAIAAAIHEELLLEPIPDRFIARESFQSLARTLAKHLENFHNNHPLRRGIQREQLRSQLGVQQATLSALLQLSDEVTVDDSIVHLNSHTIRFSEAQQKNIEQMMQNLAHAPYTPPSATELLASLGEEVFAALIERGDLVRVSSDVIFGRAAFEDMRSHILHEIDQHGEISARRLRDHFNTSRKYVIALLEYLDRIQVTKRRGDVRVRGPMA